MSGIINGWIARDHAMHPGKCSQSTSCRGELCTEGRGYAHPLHRGTRRIGAWGFASLSPLARPDKRLRRSQPLQTSLDHRSESEHRLLWRRKVAASLGSQGAGPSRNADSSGSGRYPPSSRPQQGSYRPPLQRQRPGPQRPMDSRQAPSQQHPMPQYRQQGADNQPQSAASGRPSDGRTLERPRNPTQDGLARGSSFPKNTLTVNFCLQYHTQYGQRIRLVGSHESLGAWQLRDGPDLQWTDGDNWRTSVELPGGTVYEYKYVLLDASSGHALSWQRGNNSVLALRNNEDTVEVFDNWEGQPGAAVVSEGASVTRECRLLDWANEMEALVTTQRNDLRRSRMELAAATQDAQEARQELRAARAELARAKAQQATERRKAAELEAQNQLLSQHLAETTNSFREALQLVESLMGAEDIYGGTEEDEDESELEQEAPSSSSMVLNAADAEEKEGQSSQVIHLQQQKQQQEQQPQSIANLGNTNGAAVGNKEEGGSGHSAAPDSSSSSQKEPAKTLR